MTERAHLAAHNPSLVVHTHGLMAAFNDAGVLNPLDVTAAEAVARLNGEHREAVMLAAALAVRGTRHGHVCVRLSSLREAVVVDGQEPNVVEGLPWPEPDGWRAELEASSLVGDGTEDLPLVMVGDRLYLERYYRYEQRVAELISSRLGRGRPPAGPVGDALRQLLASEAVTSQYVAATKALEGGIAVIAGGPGTGKTYTVGALLVALASAQRESFPLVAMCAPTGKAAARLGEELTEHAESSGDAQVQELMTGVAPSTIHRLLGWSPKRSRFARNETNRLPHDLVIVDEMSMVSLPLAARLLTAVRDEAGIVLVGDPFQLESIEAGTVLADIVGLAAEPSPPEVPIAERVVVLDRVYRFLEDSTIADFADAVRKGDAVTALDRLGEGDDHLQWVKSRDDASFRSLWDEVVRKRVRLVETAEQGDTHEALEALSDLAVLCAVKRGPNGVTQWSRDIEAALDEHFPGLRWGGEWYPGRPVMITRNDYNLDLYNGDIGVAVRTDEGRRAVFERGEARDFSLAHLTEHTTVHAMTIHKSQGSQFRQVVVVLPDEDSRLLTRELLYTAVTRARNRVWLVGSEAVVHEAITRSVQRASGLSSLLWDGT